MLQRLRDWARGIKRDGLFTRELSGATPHVIFEIRKSRYQQSGRALVT